MIAIVHSTTETVFLVLFFVVMAVGVIAAGVYQSRARGARSQDLARLATQLSFDSFNPHFDQKFAMGWGFVSRLDKGSDRYAFNLLQGKYHDRPLFVFDYHYQTGEGKNKSEHYLTILMLVCNEAFPKLTIGPERLLDKVAGAFGLENDIKFESAEFSSHFNVRSSDKKFAYDVCNAQMIDFLLANRDLQIEIQGPVILLAFEPQLAVEKIEYNLQRLAQIHSRLPAYLFTTA